MKLKPIELACGIVGGQAALARAIGVHPSLPNQWISGHRPIPIERISAIENATAGKVTRRDLRPDDWWQIWPELVDADHPVPDQREAA